MKILTIFCVVISLHGSFYSFSQSGTYETLTFLDPSLGRNGDNVRIYRSDNASDHGRLWIMLGDEYKADFNIGYRRYQDQNWVQLFSVNGYGDGYFARKLNVIGNLTTNGLILGQYGNALAGDSDPFQIASPQDIGNHDLLFYGNGGNSTLNLRVYDGSIKLGPSASPNAELKNNGEAYFIGNIGIGTNSPSNAQGWGKVLDVRGTSNSKILTTTSNATFRTGLYSHSTWHGGGGFIGTETDHNLHIITDYSPKISVLTNGNVGIGTTTPSHKLEVNGTIRSQEVKVEATNWPDYVFEPTYNLRTLEETEAYIQSNKHLPEIPSAKEMEANGVQLGEMNMLLLKKIEEMTLHLIEKEKEIRELKESHSSAIIELAKRIEKLEEK